MKEQLEKMPAVKLQLSDVPVLEIDDDNFEGLSAEELLQAATVEKETEEDILNNARKEAAEIIDDANKKAKDIVKQAKEGHQDVCVCAVRRSGYSFRRFQYSCTYKERSQRVGIPFR